jgi:hypothetical protein
MGNCRAVDRLDREFGGIPSLLSKCQLDIKQYVASKKKNSYLTLTEFFSFDRYVVLNVQGSGEVHPLHPAMATLFSTASSSTSSNLFGIVRGAILMMILFSNNVLSFLSSSYNKLVLTNNGMGCPTAAAMSAGVPKSWRSTSSWVRYYYSSRGTCSTTSTTMLLLTDNSKKVQKQHHYYYFENLFRLSFVEGSGRVNHNNRLHTSASDNSDTNPSRRKIGTTTSTDRGVSSTSGPSSPIAKSTSSTWNLPGLLKETNRCISRCYKKIDKVNARYTKVLQHDGSNSSSTSTSTSAEEAIILEEMKYLRKRLGDLHQLLEYLLQIHDSTTQQTILLPEHIASLALQLEINDTPPSRPPKPNSTIKAAPENALSNSGTGPRKPYRRYYTENNTEIRVSLYT